MKKLTGLLAVLLVAALTACGSGSDTGSGSSGPSGSTDKPGTSGPGISSSNSGSGDGSSTPNTTATDPVSGPLTGSPTEPQKPTAFEVGTAEELAAAILAINDMEAPEDANITLTADIDLTGFTDCDTWEPLYRYSGTFDGAGHTLKNLNWTFTMSNDGNTNMPTAESDYSYVFENLLSGSLGGNCAARATVSLLILELDGGTVKDLTLADSSMNIVCSYNKNYLMYFGSVVGYVNGGTVSNVKLTNVDMTVPSEVNYNHAFVGYAAPLIGRITGEAAVTGCSADAACLVDASGNAKTNTGKLIGIMDDAAGTLTLTDCTSEAETKVHPDPTSATLMYTGADTVYGGVAGEDLVGSDLTKG